MEAITSSAQIILCLSKRLKIHSSLGLNDEKCITLSGMLNTAGKPALVATTLIHIAGIKLATSQVSVTLLNSYVTWSHKKWTCVLREENKAV